MSDRRNINAFEFHHSDVPSENNEAFAVCPSVFLAKLTPDEYRAQQELYRRAYERAAAQLGKKNDGLGDAYSFDI